MQTIFKSLSVINVGSPYGLPWGPHIYFLLIWSDVVGWVTTLHPCSFTTLHPFIFITLHPCLINIAHPYFIDTLHLLQNPPLLLVNHSPLLLIHHSPSLLIHQSPPGLYHSPLTLILHSTSMIIHKSQPLLEHHSPLLLIQQSPPWLFTTLYTCLFSTHHPCYISCTLHPFYSPLSITAYSPHQTTPKIMRFSACVLHSSPLLRTQFSRLHVN